MRFLMERGLVRALPHGSCHEQLGMFFVEKKGSEKIRLIIEARKVNRLFRAPPGVEMCSAEGLSRVGVHLPPGVCAESQGGRAMLEETRLTLGMADVKYAFHWFRVDGSGDRADTDLGGIVATTRSTLRHCAGGDSKQELDGPSWPRIPMPSLGVSSGGLALWPGLFQLFADSEQTTYASTKVAMNHSSRRRCLGLGCPAAHPIP